MSTLVCSYQGYESNKQCKEDELLWKERVRLMQETPALIICACLLDRRIAGRSLL